MKRSKQNLSHYRLHTTEMGRLIPIACLPVLPGDTIQHSTSVLVRAAPLNTPVMHPVSCRIHHFFVPNRIIWDEWEDFITGGKDGNNNSQIPQIAAPQSSINLLTYLGIPYVEGDTNTYNALPLRAFNAIYNEYYRDQDLVNERSLEAVSTPRCAWEKDYFTTARPWTQKGDAVTIPIGESAPVKHDGTQPNFAILGPGTSVGNLIGDTSGGDDRGLSTDALPGGALNALRFGSNTGLFADLSAAVGVDVNQFREAFAIQRYQEARARYGSRFTEYLRYLGIRPSDARLQRPEYLGGGTSRLQFSEVLQTTPATEPDTAGVGDLYGHGIAGIRTPRYRKFFEEHGYVLTLMSIRPRALYLNGVPREFLKQTKEDYYQKELVHLGQQEIDTREINVASTPGVFGYQDRYDEYRYQMPQVGQDFKTTLASWHLGRDIAPNQALNSTFTDCNVSNRIFQVTEGHNMWVMANHRIAARRLLPKRSRPRIL